MNIRDSALLILFAIAICLPGAAHLAGLRQATADSEQRPLSNPPMLLVDDWEKVVPGLEAYLADHMGLRPWIVTAGHRLRYAMKAPVTHDVVLGKQGWLFYDGADEIEQWLGLRPLPAAQIDAIVIELARLDRLARAHGAKFVFVIAPNKSTVYPEYLPDGLHPIGPTPADQLIAALARRPEISVVDGRPLIARSKSRGQLYFRTDTHWNELGAFIVLQPALGRAGIDAGRLRPIDDYRIEPGIRQGDLQMFLNVGLQPERDVPTLVARFDRQGLSWKHYDGDAITSDIITRTPATGTLLVIGDSFSILWLRVLSDIFGRVVRVTKPTFKHDELIEANKPDVILLELVEREIRYWWPAAG